MFYVINYEINLLISCSDLKEELATSKKRISNLDKKLFLEKKKEKVTVLQFGGTIVDYMWGFGFYLVISNS